MGTFQRPSQAAARRNARERVFGGCTAPLWSTKVDDLSALGSGVALYFRLLNFLAVAFLVMAALTLPSLLVFKGGNRLTIVQLDSACLESVTYIASISRAPPLQRFASQNCPQGTVGVGWTPGAATRQARARTRHLFSVSTCPILTQPIL